MVYYYLPQPPIFLVLVGLFIAVTCGTAFQSVLKAEYLAKAKAKADGSFDKVNSPTLKFCFFGVCVGICVFIASGLQCFTFGGWGSYVFSLVVTLFTAYLTWSQLDEIILMLQAGGSAAIDLDSFEE